LGLLAQRGQTQEGKDEQARLQVCFEAITYHENIYKTAADRPYCQRYCMNVNSIFIHSIFISQAEVVCT
jgi:hypothetical protein